MRCKPVSFWMTFRKAVKTILYKPAVWSKRIKNLTRSHTRRRKISRNDLRSLVKKFASKDGALVVYIEVPFEDYLPNYDRLPVFQTNCERYYPLLQKIGDESYSSIVAMGIVEHLKDPVQLFNECFRILKPGGKMYVSASSVFSVHRGPDDYFHTTQFGMKEWLSRQNWSHTDIKGSCPPFKTIGILLQRILLQCETSYFIRPFVYFLVKVLPLLDRFIIHQYADRSFSEEQKIDSMMPSNIQVVATK